MLLQGTGKDGKPATFIFEFSAKPLVGPNNSQVMLSPVETTLHVYKMGANGAPALAPIPGNAPGTAAAPQSDTGKAGPQAAVLVQQISPPSACAGAPSEPRLAVGDEYNYGVVWCPNSTSATKSAKKNYHYMFANGNQALVLTMDFNCATDTAFMPPAVVTYCQS